MTADNPINTASQFGMEYLPQIDVLGYSLMSGLNVKDRPGTIDAIISPKQGSQNPIAPDLFTRITEEIIPKEYKGLPVNVVYEEEGMKLQ